MYHSRINIPIGFFLKGEPASGRKQTIICREETFLSNKKYYLLFFVNPGKGGEI
jgi:hypothetical protein